MVKIFVLSFLSIGAFATSAIAESVFFRSPNGLQEECRIVAPMAGGDYDEDDHEEERELCSIDFYNSSLVALCPKTWSTSPGTMVYDISKSGKDQATYESSSACGGSKSGHTKITKFKQTMNQSGTSGTFSPSSLLYYHFSRYFDTAVTVPVAVYRSMDRASHYDRVTYKAYTKTMGKGDMNRKGWEWLYKAEGNPSTYRPTSELFTQDLSQIYGVLGDGSGVRYGSEVNGIRSAWGDRQNLDFQETPGFLALRSERPLVDAIRDGVSKASSSPKMKKAMAGVPSNFQVAVWMKEISEIVLLDYIFSQQDRIGNIDFKWYIYYVNAKGTVKADKLKSELARTEMGRISYPKDVDGATTLLVQRTRINDNDAGGKEVYSNFTKRTKMLEKVRHFSPKTYDRLQTLNADFQAHGPYYQYLKSEFGISSKQVEKIVANTKEAAAILESTVRSGKMQFDLDSVKNMFVQLK